MTMHVRDAGVWKDVRADGLYVRDAGTWKQVKEGYVRDAGTWKSFHVQSDPLTVTNLTADWSWAFHGPKTTDAWITGAGSDANGQPFSSAGYALYGLTDGDVLHGNWSNNAYDVGSLGLQTGLIGFRDIIKPYLDVRPVITACTFEITARTTYTDSVNIYLGTFPDSGTQPATFVHTDTDKYLQVGTDPFTDSETNQLVLNSTMRSKLATQYGIALHATHNVSPNVTRGGWRGVNAGATAPKIVSITFDYV